MNLEETLKDAVKHIRSGLLKNEAMVKLSVIVPILRGLDWDDTNPAEFVPEFSLDNGNVDYALCQENHGPMVFLEAKRLGGADSVGEDQVFGYAANKGVPLLILTDGNAWNFYLSMAAGIPAERRFYRMELQREEKIPEYAEFLDMHLRKSRVFTEEARRNAEKLHTSGRRRKQARDAIPNVWQSLFNPTDETLRDLLAEAVESECGIRPELDDVEDFLSTQSSSTDHQQMTTATFPPHKGKTPVPSNESGKKLGGYVFGGKTYKNDVAYKVLAEVLKDFHRRNPEFMVRYASKTMGRTRRLVAQNREDLYNRSEYAHQSEDLGNGWWLQTHLSGAAMRNHIKTACQVAEVQFGIDLKLIEH